MSHLLSQTARGGRAGSNWLAAGCLQGEVADRLATSPEITGGELLASRAA
jgi:hypothetical protein